MKVNSPGTITFFINHKNEKIFKDIPLGVDIRAKIIERKGGNSAILEISGRKVSAEFTGGVPEKNSLVLRHETSAGNAFTFRLVKEPDNGLLEFIGNISIFRRETLMHRGLESLRLTGGGITGIFELNRLLAGHGMREPGDRRALQILNSLLKTGISRETVINLSFLFSGGGVPPAIMNFLYALTGSGHLDPGRVDLMRACSSRSSSPQHTFLPTILSG